MELRYLLTFQTIVRLGSFGKAAEALSYAPSTITLHMQHLETELGFKLFVRQGKQIQLSTAGQALYEQADRLLQQARSLEQTMKEIVAGGTGSLRIGAIEPAASRCLMPLLAQFCQEYPNMHVMLEVTGTRFLCNALAKGSWKSASVRLPRLNWDSPLSHSFLNPSRCLFLPSTRWPATKTCRRENIVGQEMAFLTEFRCFCCAQVSANQWFKSQFRVQVDAGDVFVPSHCSRRSLSYTSGGDDSSWYPQTAIRSACWHIDAQDAARRR